MALTSEEKALVQEALQIYLQIVARQLPPPQVQRVVAMAEGVVKKLDTLGSGNKKGNTPDGISDEWFKNVCKTCDKLGPTGCLDKVTEKFPGKCDPILLYERKKQQQSSS